MFKIVGKRKLAENVNEYVIQAGRVAQNAQAGQFVILRVDERGERIPFTICQFDKTQGTVTILVQTIGATTMQLEKLGVGDTLHDFVGPLGNPTNLSKYQHVLLVGGGIGAAVIYPQAIKLHENKQRVDVVIGARNQSLIMYEQEFKREAENIYIATDDGSYGEKGFVTDIVKRLLNEDKSIDVVLAVGPLVMMRAVCEVTRLFGVKTIVSMNSIMVDGTGMCGCCRLTVGGKTKYACVDGPEFDGHEVDFSEAINRSKMFVAEEKEHVCRLKGKI